MTISLYDASVLTYLQIVRAVGGYLEKGLVHCRSHDIDPETLVETSMYPDMRPLRFQVTSVVHHSQAAAAALTSGVFRPPSDKTPYDYAALQKLIAETSDALGLLKPDAINARAGADVAFEVADSKRLFTAESFVLSFSLPNFYFHATTTYDILRSKGVPLGKRDFIGAPRLKP